MKKIAYCLAAACIFLVFSCKKKMNDETATRLDLLRDSVYLYSKEVYLWADKIPSYGQFNPRKYSGATELETAKSVMNAIKAFEPLDRFSFVATQEDADGLQTGADKDFGFFIKAASIDKTEPLDSIFWFVTYAYNQSAAGMAGVRRSWYISKINGTAIGYNQASVDILNNVFFGNTSSASFEFTLPDNSTVTKSLTKTSFVANSVLHHSVINVSGGKKVGYLVFNQFFGQPSRNELKNTFADFQAQGINELVVDLRYNPGGSVETQDTLANLIAPVSANDKTMYQYIFNSTLQNNQHQLIRKRLGYGNIFAAANNTVKFKKAGNLNLSRVFVIVSGSSASASELLINNLRPYMDVKLIGDTTYGKPVGFFPIPVYDYAIYPISFKTVNSAGSADYYSGFAPDKTSPDGVNKNWGDVQEPNLAYALSYISTGSFGRIGSTATNLQWAGQQKAKWSDKLLHSQKFVGMFIKK